MKCLSRATQENGYVFIVADDFGTSPMKQLGEMPQPKGKFYAFVSENTGLQVECSELHTDDEFIKLQIAIHLCTEEFQTIRANGYNYQVKRLREFDWRDELVRMQANQPRGW